MPPFSTLIGRRTSRRRGPIPGADTAAALAEPSAPAGPAGQSARIPAVFLIHDFQGGGAERAVIRYMNRLERIDPVAAVVRWRMELLPELRRDVPVVDLSAPFEFPPDPAGRELRRGETRGELPGSEPMAVWLASLLSGRIPLQLLRKALRLRRLIRATGAEMVATFLPQSHILAAMAGILSGGRLRIVVNVHEMVSDPLIYLHPPVDRLLIQAFDRWFFPRADLVVAVSEGVRADLVENFGVPPDRAVVLHNPVDLSAIRSAGREPVVPAWKRDPARPLLLAVGRLVKLKGFDVLLRAFARLPEELGARLAIIGEGEEREALEALIRTLELGGSVKLLGWQHNPWKYMARSEAVVLSSLTEAFPNVIGEAMALGIPVLATDCSPGIREYVERGRSGLLARPGDEADLAAGMERLLRDESLRRRLGERGRRRVEAFGPRRTVEAYERALFRVVVAGRDRHRAPTAPAFPLQATEEPCD